MLLGQSLHRIVGLEGEGTRDGTTDELIRFTVDALAEYRELDPKTGRQPSVRQAFQNLADLSSGVWDGVDAEAFVRNLRDHDAEDDRRPSRSTPTSRSGPFRATPGPVTRINAIAPSPCRPTATGAAGPSH